MFALYHSSSSPPLQVYPAPKKLWPDSLLSGEKGTPASLLIPSSSSHCLHCRLCALREYELRVWAERVRFVFVCVCSQTVAECVLFYYLTKKNENYKNIVRRNYRRRGRSQVSLRLHLPSCTFNTLMLRFIQSCLKKQTTNASICFWGWLSTEKIIILYIVKRFIIVVDL